LKGVTGPAHAFRQQRNNARRCGIGWELTLWQWWSIWQASGKWPERGRVGYWMCRHDKARPFTVDNVFICRAHERGEHPVSQGINHAEERVA
jgi:hypothetical protein